LSSIWEGEELLLLRLLLLLLLLLQELLLEELLLEKLLLEEELLLSGIERCLRLIGGERGREGGQWERELRGEGRIGEGKESGIKGSGRLTGGWRYGETGKRGKRTRSVWIVGIRRSKDNLSVGKLLVLKARRSKALEGKRSGGKRADRRAVGLHRERSKSRIGGRNGTWNSSHCTTRKGEVLRLSLLDGIRRIFLDTKTADIGEGERSRTRSSTRGT